ncbi:hypothetical protein H4R33_006911 [Dimargaris cristalligena]|nr:hypothetical protein H4R33_006911 [Dimargaris cristalligena]
MGRFAYHFVQAIGSLGTLDHRSLFRDVELFSDNERHQLLHSFATNPVPIDTPIKYAYSYFEHQARDTPDQIALIMGSQKFTYAQLDSASNHFAQQLSQATDCGPDRLIGILADRSLKLVVSELAIWKTGSAFVCIVPDLPVDRKQFIVDDARCAAIVGRPEHLSELEGCPVQCISIDAISLLSNPRPVSFESPIIRPAELAYVIYTSRTTGTPKGVTIKHRSISHLLQNFNIGTPTGSGKIVPSTRVFTIPSLISCFDPADFPNIRRLVLGGESVSAKVVQNWGPATELINGYGPTETTIFSHWTRLHSSDLPLVPIGTPIPNATGLILDPQLRPVPIGATGQLYLGGPGIARGYLNRPKLTRAKFNHSPFTGERIYQPGDLARWLLDGRVECLGRADNQVKMRGFRIELGEIEAALERHPAVHQACAVVQDGAHLVGYVVPPTTKIPEILDTLLAQLPHYMVPSTLVPMSHLPLTRVGKIDRMALPRFAFISEVNEATHRERDPTEELVVSLIAETLQVDQVVVSHDTTFFQLGGNSLTAIQFVSHCRRQHLGLELVDINRANTISDLVALATLTPNSADNADALNECFEDELNTQF